MPSWSWPARCAVAEWPYNTTAWQRLRRAKLRASPLCEPCGRLGRIVPANTVDHIKSIASSGDPFPPLAGLMSMCPACHNTKTNAVDRAGGKGVAFKGADASGLPIDPSHPFFGGDTPFKDERLGVLDRPGARACTKFRKRGRSWG